MDPQKLSQLDPKLRDAYQRVMGTTIPQPQTPPAQTQDPIQPISPTPAPQPQSTPAVTSASEPFITSQPAINQQPQSIPTPEMSVPAQPASNFVQMNSEVPAPSQNFTAPPLMPQAQTMAVKKKSGIMMPIIFGIVGLIFLVIYTLFWTKIFNLKLPFLP